MLLINRILRVLAQKLRLSGDFDFRALAKATPGYVGADLTALTSAAGIVAVKRIFQQLSVPEIVEQVFRRLGYDDFELRLVGTYPKRDYCVQYRETHLDFVSRLLEDEGIYYFFEHTRERHVLVLADAPTTDAEADDADAPADAETLQEDA